MEQRIYIVLTNSGTIPGRLVSKMTRFYYSHVMLALYPDLREMYSFGRKSVYNFLNGGFVIEQPKSAFFTRFSETWCRVMALDVTLDQLHRLETALRPFLDHPEQYRYDFIGCALRYFKCKKTFAWHYTCSHFVAEVLQNAGICQFSAGTMLARPEDFANLPGSIVIYEGKLQELPEDLISDNRRMKECLN